MIKEQKYKLRIYKSTTWSISLNTKMKQRQQTLAKTIETFFGFKF